MSQDMTSFVVRFVRESAGDTEPRWRGMINHVQSNTRENFTQFAEAIRFMQEQLGKEVVQQFFSPELLAETAQLWGTFAVKYQQSLAQTWLESFASPARVQQSITNTLKSWQLPDRVEQEAAIRELEQLTRRVEELTRQVEQIERAVHPRTADDSAQQQVES